MVRFFSNPPRKQRTRAHVLADLSANHVERFALKRGFAVERIHQDYGLDLAVFTFDDDGFAEAGVIWMQLKATDSVKLTHEGQAAMLRIDRRDLLNWITEVDPVILVLYDATEDRAFWLWVQREFAIPEVFGRIKGKTVTISIPITNLVNEGAFRAMAQMKSEIHSHRGDPT